MAKKRKGIPLGIVPPTGAMTPEQLANRLNQRAVRIPHKHRQDSVRDRNAAQSQRNARNPRSFLD